MTHEAQVRPIQPREKLDFQLGCGIPCFWNGGDPFKTRFFDAMSLTFPIGERYFISTVRAHRDQIADPHLLQEVKDFTRIAGLIYFSIGYPIGNWFMVNRLLYDDGFGFGFGFWQRAKMLLKGAWWLYKPGFHPWQHTEMGHDETWLNAYERTGDPVMAAEAYSAQVMGAN